MSRKKCNQERVTAPHEERAAMPQSAKT
jgi:rare lipoprotein A